MTKPTLVLPSTGDAMILSHTEHETPQTAMGNLSPPRKRLSLGADPPWQQQQQPLSPSPTRAQHYSLDEWTEYPQPPRQPAIPKSPTRSKATPHHIHHKAAHKSPRRAKAAANAAAHNNNKSNDSKNKSAISSRVFSMHHPPPWMASRGIDIAASTWERGTSSSSSSSLQRSSSAVSATRSHHRKRNWRALSVIPEPQLSQSQESIFSQPTGSQYYYLPPDHSNLPQSAPSADPTLNSSTLNTNNNNNNNTSGNSGTNTSMTFAVEEDHERPDTSHFSVLLGALLLINVLGALAALDAKQECLTLETNALISLMDTDDDQQDDDANNNYNNQNMKNGEDAVAGIGDYDAEQVYEDAYDQAFLKEAENGCIRLFRLVVLPVVLITVCLGILGLALLRHHPQSTPKQTWRMTWRMLLVFLLILVAQTYNVALLMVSPRRTSDSSSGSGNINNPFHSLGAVDLLGNVADNANLYYLTWISQSLALALVYQFATATLRAYRALQAARRDSTLLPSTSWYIMTSTYEQDLESRHAWYKSLYKLRIRNGIWTAALLSCLVITASAQYIFREVLWPFVIVESEPDDDAGGAGDDDLAAVADDGISSADADRDFMDSLLTLDVSVCQAVYQNSNEDISIALCRRTVIAWLSGVIAMFLCLVAMGTHWIARVASSYASNTADATPGTADTHHHHINVFERMRHRHRIPLGIELVVSLLVSALLGTNAVLSTGVQGPAATVGNLYYASWLAFLLSIRICLGCLEEWYKVEEGGQNNALIKQTASNGRGSGNDLSRSFSQNNSYLAPSISGVDKKGEDLSNSITLLSATIDVIPEAPSGDSESTGDQSQFMDTLEKDRTERLRSYLFLGIFSAVCAASAYDVASNQEEELNRTQRYIILSPVIVACLSLVLFFLCLSKGCYVFVSHVGIGGILSIVSFCMWVADLVLTMHSETSWAVNKIGEIKMANLYYFSWAGVLTAGMQLMSYIKAFFNIGKEHNMSVVWVGICKVCFVILGAGMHIWYNISDKCDIAELTTGAVTFCSRTVLAIVVALTGMLVGCVVVLVRFFQTFMPACQCSNAQAHVEMLLSVFLFFLFITAVALITGIGGPGQSVGDLYYSTWLAFAVSLGIFLHCFEQINQAEDKRRSMAAITTEMTHGSTKHPRGHLHVMNYQAYDSVMV